MQKSRRKKNEETKRRFEAIKDLMSTFAMATVAVVAVATLVPTSPKAEITKIVSLSEEIVYQVNVTDEDNGLDLSTLFVVLENQLEYYEQSINLGENSGYFDGLETDTEYRLSVYGNKGFGQERLDTLMITTSEKVGGTILSVTPIINEFFTSYNVDISIYDPDLKYDSVTLYYGYSWEDDTEISYSSIAITSSRMTIDLFDIHTSEAFHIYLEGTTSEGTELLDEIWVTPPFELNISLYTDYINKDEIGFFVYSHMSVQSIRYEMNIYIDDLLIRTDQIVLAESEFEGNRFIIDELSENTIYTFECIAIYTNPQTLRQEKAVIYQEEITTLDFYTYSYIVETFDDYMEVTIIIDDPNHYFQNANYESYDTSGELNMYLTGETFMFNTIDNVKSVTFTIPIPTATAYQITISIRKQTDSLIKQIIDIMNYE